MRDESEHSALLGQRFLDLVADLIGILRGQQIDEQVVGDRPGGSTFNEDHIFSVFVTNQSHEFILIESPRFHEIGEAHSIVEFVPFIALRSDSDCHAQ